MFDVLIKDTMVMDGTGNPWFRADVSIKDERIVKIGEIPSTSADRVIDGRKLVTAPGFIDVHNHEDLVVMQDDHPQVVAPFLRQGVTTIVIGNCAYGAAPVKRENLDLIKGFLNLITGKDIEFTWTTMDEYLTKMEQQGVVFNVAALLAHAPIRFSVMGASDAGPTNPQLDEMKSLVRESMLAGSWGFSTGLLYPPGIWTPTGELIELCKVVGEFDGLFTSHVRGSSETGISAEKEIIRIGEEAGVRVHHSHHEAFGKRFWPQIKRTVKLDEEARKRGLDIASDVIPYTTANTTLRAIFPPWALAGGVPELIKRLKDPETRKKIRRDIEEVIPKWPPWGPGGWPHNLVEATGYANIVISFVKNPKYKKYVGKTLAEVGRIEGKHPFDAACDMLIDAQGDIMALYYGVSGDRRGDRALQYVLKHPFSGASPDAIILGKEWSHPGGYGGFVRVIAHFARDLGLFSMEEAVRKITSFPAGRLHLRDRGLIREGMYADVVIFDPLKVKDKATYDSPTQFPEGIRYVFVNGKLVVENGEQHKLLPGAVLRKEIVAE
jgi:N-acyl-D-aspartate/D-glutamate deacylase